MRRRLLFLVFFLVAAVGTNAQPCLFTFSGTVVSEKGEPLPGASVLLEPIHKGTVTDINGRFWIEGLCPGRFNITVRYLGYKTITLTETFTRSESHNFRMDLDEVQLNEVVVEQKVENIGNAKNFVELSGKNLSELAGKSLGETIREIPGVSSIQAGPGIFKPVIHGVHSQRVLILNHGIRHEGQQWGAEHAPEIDPFMASDITIIKDASSIKYGVDAIGGVVVVNPPALPIEAALGGSMQLIGQSNGRSGAVAGMLEGGITGMDGWGWRLQGSAKQSGDFYSPTYSLTNTGLKELNFSAATGYHTEKGGAEVYLSHFQTEVGILKGTSIGSLEDLLLAMESDVPQNTNSFSYDLGEPRQEVSHDLLKVKGHVHSDAGEWRMQYGFQNNQRREFDVRKGNLSNLPAIDLQLFTHTLEADWKSLPNEKHSLSFGVTGMYQDNNNIPGTQRIPFIPNFNNLSGGVFGIANRYWKGVSLDIGVRYDFKNYDVVGFDFKNSLYQNRLSFHNVSATMGASIKGKRSQFNTSLSNAWRPPHVAELFSLGTHQSAAAIEYGLFLNDSTNEVMQQSEVDFQNEKALKWVNTWQVNIRQWSIELSGYANYIFNYFYLRPTGVTQNVRGTYPYFRYTQTDALFLGLDVSTLWRVNEKWKVTPRASFLRASDQTNNDYLIFIPPNRTEVAVRYESKPDLRLKNFFVEVRGKYVFRQSRAPRVITVRQFNDALEAGTDPLLGSRDNFDFMAAPAAYGLLAASLGFSVPVKKVRYDFRASAENLLNTRFREYTNRFRYYADDLGRNFLLSAKCVF